MECSGAHDSTRCDGLVLGISRRLRSGRGVGGRFLRAGGVGRCAGHACGVGVGPWLAEPLPFATAQSNCGGAGHRAFLAISGVVNPFAALLVVGTALALLLESFGRDMGWLYRAGARRLTRRIAGAATALVSAAIVWGALVAPDRLGRLTPAAFVRILIEGLC